MPIMLDRNVSISYYLFSRVLVLLQGSFFTITILLTLVTAPRSELDSYVMPGTFVYIELKLHNLNLILSTHLKCVL